MKISIIRKYSMLILIRQLFELTIIQFFVLVIWIRQRRFWLPFSKWIWILHCEQNAQGLRWKEALVHLDCYAMNCYYSFAQNVGIPALSFVWTNITCTTEINKNQQKSSQRLHTDEMRVFLMKCLIQLQLRCMYKSCSYWKKEESLDSQYVKIHNHSNLLRHISGEVVRWQISGKTERKLVSTET
jgi:hypothetical protein